MSVQELVSLETLVHVQFVQNGISTTIAERSHNITIRVKQSDFPRYFHGGERTEQAVSAGIKFQPGMASRILNLGHLPRLTSCG
jgi:hypothetical protein